MRYDNPIIITRDTIFDYSDLLRVVDFSKPFTLEDLFISVNNTITNKTGKSKIILETLEQILRFPYFKEYYKEMQKQSIETESHIEYLELVYNVDNKDPIDNYWDFVGRGKEGVVSKDLINAKIDIGDPKKFRERYAIEYTEVCKIKHLTIKMSDTITVYGKKGITQPQLKIQLSLIELLRIVFNELGFFGCPKTRNDKALELYTILDERMKIVNKNIIIKEKKSYSFIEALKRVEKRAKKNKK